MRLLIRIRHVAKVLLIRCLFRLLLIRVFRAAVLPFSHKCLRSAVSPSRERFQDRFTSFGKLSAFDYFLEYPLNYEIFLNFMFVVFGAGKKNVKNSGKREIK